MSKDDIDERLDPSARMRGLARSFPDVVDQGRVGQPTSKPGKVHSYVAGALKTAAELAAQPIEKRKNTLRIARNAAHQDPLALKVKKDESVFVSAVSILREGISILFSEERKKTPTIEKRCVSDVMVKNPNWDMSRAFAVCRSSMQKAGNYRSGSADLTKNGAAKSAGKSRAKDNPAKSIFFKSQVKAAREE